MVSGSMGTSCGAKDRCSNSAFITSTTVASHPRVLGSATNRHVKSTISSANRPTVSIIFFSFLSINFFAKAIVQEHLAFTCLEPRQHLLGDDQRCVGFINDFFKFGFFGHFSKNQPLIGNIDHGKFSNDPVYTIFSCQRQRAFF